LGASKAKVTGYFVGALSVKKCPNNLHLCCLCDYGAKFGALRTRNPIDRQTFLAIGQDARHSKTGEAPPGAFVMTKAILTKSLGTVSRSCSVASCAYADREDPIAPYIGRPMASASIFGANSTRNPL
jgi:hypothetical protein